MLSTGVSAAGYSAEHKMGLGLNYPGISFKYLFSGAAAAEIRYQTTGNIHIGGVRAYYYFKQYDVLKLFAGGELSYIYFKGDVSEGSGMAGAVLAGGEYFFRDQMSFQADIGPAYILLGDRDTEVSLAGIEIVLNLGVNYYC